MSLWGNNDSVYSAGTVSVDLGTKTVTGSGTTFTTAGIKTGDVITVGTGGTYGQSVITGFTSTTISIATTEAFISGVTTIPAVVYNINQQPIYPVFDSTFNNKNDALASLKDFGVTGTATTNSPVGFSTVYLVTTGKDIIAGDTLLNGGNDIVISTVNSTNIALASTISSGISTGDTLTFKRRTGGYFKDVFGVDQIETGVAATTKYAVAHSGWVGILTYIDSSGALRVKSEVLVAGGISTTTDASDDARFPDS